MVDEELQGEYSEAGRLTVALIIFTCTIFVAAMSCVSAFYQSSVQRDLDS